MALLDEAGIIPPTPVRYRRPSFVSGFRDAASIERRRQQEEELQQRLADMQKLQQIRRQAENMQEAQRQAQMERALERKNMSAEQRFAEDVWPLVKLRDGRQESAWSYDRLRSSLKLPPPSTKEEGETVPYLTQDAKEIERIGMLGGSEDTLTALGVYNRYRDQLANDYANFMHLPPAQSRLRAEADMRKAYTNIKSELVKEGVSEEEAGLQVNIGFRYQELLNAEIQRYKLPINLTPRMYEALLVDIGERSGKDIIGGIHMQLSKEFSAVLPKSDPGFAATLVSKVLSGAGAVKNALLTPDARRAINWTWGNAPLIPAFPDPEATGTESELPLTLVTPAKALQLHNETRATYEPGARFVAKNIILPTVGNVAAGFPAIAEEAIQAGTLGEVEARGKVSQPTYDAINSQVAEDIVTEVINPVDLTIAFPFAMSGSMAVAAAQGSKAAIAARFVSEMVGTGLEPGLVQGTARGAQDIIRFGPRAISRVPDMIRATPHFRQAFSNIMSDVFSGALTDEVALTAEEQIAKRQILDMMFSGQDDLEVLQRRFSHLGPNFVHEVLLSANRHLGRDILDITTQEAPSDLAKVIDRGHMAGATEEEKFRAALEWVKAKYPTWYSKVPEIKFLGPDDIPDDIRAADKAFDGLTRGDGTIEVYDQSYFSRSFSPDNYANLLVHEMSHVRDKLKRPELFNLNRGPIVDKLPVEMYRELPEEALQYRHGEIAQTRYQEFVKAVQEGRIDLGKKALTKININVTEEEMRALKLAKTKWVYNTSERGAVRLTRTRLAKQTQQLMRRIDKGEAVKLPELKAVAAAEGMQVSKKTTSAEAIRFLRAKREAFAATGDNTVATIIAHARSAPEAVPQAIDPALTEAVTKAEKKLLAAEKKAAEAPANIPTKTQLPEDLVDQFPLPEVPSRRIEVGGKAKTLKEPTTLEEAGRQRQELEDYLEELQEKIDDTELESTAEKLQERYDDLEQYKSELDDWWDEVIDYGLQGVKARGRVDTARTALADARLAVSAAEEANRIPLPTERFSVEELRASADSLGIEYPKNASKKWLLRNIMSAADSKVDAKAAELVQKRVKELDALRRERVAAYHMKLKQEGISTPGYVVLENAQGIMINNDRALVVSPPRDIVPYEGGGPVALADQPGMADVQRTGYVPDWIFVDANGNVVGGASEMMDNTRSFLDNRYVSPLRRLHDVADEVKQVGPGAMRRVLRDTLFGLINPSALTDGREAQLVVAADRQFAAIDDMADVAVTQALDKYVQAFTGRHPTFSISASGKLKNVTAKEEGASLFFQDVFSNPGAYNLTKKQAEYIQDYHSVIDEAELVREAAGLSKRHRVGTWMGDGDQSWFYIPRFAQEVHGVRPIKPSNPNLSRSFDQVEAGHAANINYLADPRENLKVYLRSVYTEIIQKELSDSLAEYAIKPREVVAAKNRGLIDRIDEARENYRKAAYEVRKWTVPRTGMPRAEWKLRNQWKMSREAAYEGLEDAKRRLKSVAGEYREELRKAQQKQVIYEQDGETITLKSWRNRFFPQDVTEQLEKLIPPSGMPEEDYWIAARGIEQVGNAVRFLSATADFAAPFIHGLPMLATNPVAWTRATANHYAAFIDPKVRTRLIQGHAETFKQMARYGIPVGDPEFFAALNQGGLPSAPGALLEKVAGKGSRALARNVGRQTVGRFQSTYNVYLGYSRALMWEALEPHFSSKADLAAHIRNLTGGLDSKALGVKATQRGLESVLLAFSPRLLRSTAALMYDAVHLNTQRGRRAFRSLASLAAASVGVYIAAGLGAGYSWEEITTGLNPLNGKKFLSYNVNGDWIGLGGQVRAISQLLAAIAVPATSELGLTPGPGLAGYNEFVTNNPYDNPLLSFYMARGAPALTVAGGGIEAFTGKDVMPYVQIGHGNFIDRITDYADHIGTSALPFAVQGYMEGQQWETVLASMVGARTSAGTPTELAQARFAIKYQRTYNPESPADRKVMREDEELQYLLQNHEETLLSAASSVPGVQQGLEAAGAARVGGYQDQPSDYEVKRGQLNDDLADLERESGILEIAQRALNGDADAAANYGRWRADYLKQASVLKNQFYKDVEFKGSESTVGKVVDQYYQGFDPLNYISAGEIDFDRFNKARSDYLDQELKAGNISQEDIDAIMERERFVNPELNELDERYRTAKKTRDELIKREAIVKAQVDATPKYIGLSTPEEAAQVDQLVDAAKVISAFMRLSGQSVGSNEIIGMLTASGYVPENVGVVAFFRATSGLGDLVWNHERDKLTEDYRDSIGAATIANPDLPFMYKSIWDKMSRDEQEEWVVRNPDKIPPGPVKEEQEDEEEDIMAVLSNLFQ